jgi:VWFA-related protein
MSKPAGKAAFALSIAVLSATAQAPVTPPQAPVTPDDYVLRSDVNMVVIHATVQERGGAFVSGLTKDAFAVEEDGVRQKLTVFSSVDVPVAVGLVIDSSGSMANRRADVITGALFFIRESRPEDEIFVINFNDTAEPGLPPDRPFSSDVNELRAALMKGVVQGHTALYDAVALALDHFEKASRMKKVLLIVSDGGDNRSSNRLEEVVRRADRAGVLMYTVGLFDEHSADKNPGVLRQLARQTGGLAYLPEDSAKVSEICSQIARDIRNQYTLGYVSGKAAGDAAFHGIKVTAVDSRGRKLRVRARTGFYGTQGIRETAQPARPSPQ